jgi:hypothetical protein
MVENSAAKRSEPSNLSANPLSVLLANTSVKYAVVLSVIPTPYCSTTLTAVTFL